MSLRTKAFIVTTILYIIGCVLFLFEGYDYSLFAMYMLYFSIIVIVLSCPVWDFIKEENENNQHLKK